MTVQFLLQTDEIGDRIAGYSLFGPEGVKTFETMEEVLLSIQDVPVADCAWFSLADALVDLTWRQDQWGEGTTSQTVTYWDHAAGEAKRINVSNPHGERIHRSEIGA